MTDFLLAQARVRELTAAEHLNSHRRDWHALRKIDRLEKALRVEKTRLYIGTATQPA